MNRVLIIIAVVGFALATVCFTGAFALGGREIMRSGFFPWQGDWDWEDEDGGPSRVTWGGPTVTREIAWTDSDEIKIAVPADVVFTQGPVTKLTITGPKDAVERVILDDETLRFQGRRGPFGRSRGSWGAGAPRLQVALAAPDTRSFSLYGSPDLQIEGFDQASLDVSIHGGGDVVAKGKVRRLDVEVRGSGDVDMAGLVAEDAGVEMMGSGKAKFASEGSAEVSIHGSGDVSGVGRAKRVEIAIYGSGDADLSGVDAEDAEVKIMGSGKAAVAPKGVADIAIFGSGDVDLAAKPARLDSKINGSGKIHERLAEPPAAPANVAAAAK